MSDVGEIVLDPRDKVPTNLTPDEKGRIFVANHDHKNKAKYSGDHKYLCVATDSNGYYFRLAKDNEGFSYRTSGDL